MSASLAPSIRFLAAGCLVTTLAAGLVGLSPEMRALQERARLLTAVTDEPPVLKALTVYHPSVALAPRRGPSDPAELERFLDPIFGQYMGGLHIPGAVFCMVKDGKVFFSKGYGYANLEARTPVQPDRTLFRVASVSKLFVATAAMQLAEQGRLDLHADVNRYLSKFTIPATYPEPVTMAQLLTHTAGFDEQVLGMAVRKEVDRQELGDYLARRMPARVMPPGSVSSYSNHGSALAGHVEEAITGIPFAEYVQQNIFEPLEMNHSSFRLPARLAPDMATGYDYDAEDKTRHPIPFDYMNIEPAGALNSTALDMAHFMIAHLQDGRFSNRRILQENTAREMHRQQFTHHPDIPGFCYGFYERFQNGQRTIEHGGLWRGFGTLLLLLPDEHLGFFVSRNSTQPLLGELLAWEFLHHYYGSPPGARLSREPGAPRRVPAARSDDLDRFAGTYRYNRYDRHTPLKLAALFGGFQVSSHQGVLVVHTPFAEPIVFRPVKPLLFRMDGGDILLAFRQDRSGHITNAFLGMAAFDHLAFYETGNFQFIVLMVLAGLFLSTMWWSMKGIFGDRSNVRLAIVRSVSRGIAAGNIIFLVSFPGALLDAGLDIVYGMPFRVGAWLALPLINLLLSIGLLVFLIRTRRSEAISFADRVPIITLLVAELGYVLVLNYWNLIAFRF